MSILKDKVLETSELIFQRKTKTINAKFPEIKQTKYSFFYDVRIVFKSTQIDEKWWMKTFRLMMKRLGWRMSLFTVRRRSV